MFPTVRAVLVALFASAPVLWAAPGAQAQDRLRWPTQTYMAAPQPEWVGKTRWVDEAPSRQGRPFAVTAAHPGERFDPVYAARAAYSYGQCRAGENCVKCVANCDNTAPVVVQKLTKQQMAASRDPGGAPELLIENRGHWNAIRCYDDGGCTAHGVLAPGRRWYFWHFFN